MGEKAESAPCCEHERTHIQSNQIRVPFYTDPKENSDLAGGDVTQEKFFLSGGRKRPGEQQLRQ